VDVFFETRCIARIKDSGIGEAYVQKDARPKQPQKKTGTCKMARKQPHYHYR